MSNARRHPLWAPVRDILRNDWNPVGVKDLPDDEYDSYVWQVVGKLHHGASEVDIATQLSELRGKWFGVSEPHDSDKAVAAKLVSLRSRD